MHTEQFDEIGDRYDHVYIAPHLDDAALSCGGTIAGQRAEGQRVLVVTLCTAAPPPEGPFSELAQRFHAEWGLAPDQVVAERLREDRRAMEILDVDSYWAGRLDAIYRYPQAYTSRESLFNTAAPDDPLRSDLRALLDKLRARLPEATFYAPLHIGDHADHQITFQAVTAIDNGQFVFYEDVPYVSWPGAVERRMAALDESYRSFTIGIDATLQTKLDAINAYASQMSELFGSAAQMEETVRSYTHSVRPADGQYGERMWRRD